MVSEEMSNYFSPVSNTAEIKPGTIIRRAGSGKDQQGRFTGYDDNMGLIVVSVVDLSIPSYAAPAGIIRPAPEDKLFIFNDTFRNSKDSSKAFEILTAWPLYRKHIELQPQIEDFIKTTYSPSQILDFKKNDTLNKLFIPMQQKLKIGRFQVKENPERTGYNSFLKILETLKPGEHITYLAMIPATSSFKPKFYSIGTKPHEETFMSLRSESFNFKPTHGGHIRSVKEGDKIIYQVDAGSNFIGKGIKTKIDTARNISNALKKEYKKFSFVPLEGRGAFGREQSY
jgi:hypothetical protein